MCGRFTLTTTWDDLKDAFPEFEFIFDSESPVSYNIAPSQQVLIASAFKPESVSRLSWGLIPFWSKDDKFAAKMINARVESIFEKPSFKNAIKQRRCLVFANGYYEWVKQENQKQPYYVRLKSGQPFTFGGIWESWKQPDGIERKTFSIITTPANPEMSKIHNRMPLILSRKYYQTWLDNQVDINDIKKALKAYGKDDLEYYAVSNRVNNVRNNDIDCIKKAS